MNENVNPKGRKFTAMIIGVTFGVLYIIACAIRSELVALSGFAMTVEGIIVSYMGANAYKAGKVK